MQYYLKRSMLEEVIDTEWYCSQYFLDLLEKMRDDESYEWSKKPSGSINFGNLIQRPLKSKWDEINEMSPLTWAKEVTKRGFPIAQKNLNSDTVEKVLKGYYNMSTIYQIKESREYVDNDSGVLVTPKEANIVASVLENKYFYSQDED